MLRFLLWLGRWPEGLLYGLSGFLAFLLCHVFRYRRKTVRRNLAKAFPELDERQLNQRAWAFYRHIADVVVEILRLAHLTPDDIRARVEMRGVEHLRHYAERGQSFIVLGAHQANWEWMLAALSLACPCPLDALYRPIHHDVMEEYFRYVRTRFGAAMIPAANASRAILKRRKETRAFGIMADQTPRRCDDKLWVPFMGIDTPVFPGPDKIARMTGYPCVFIATEWVRRGHYVCTITPLAEPPYDSQHLVATPFMARVEEQIRRQPERWMWSHRRWRYRRDQSPANRNVSLD